MTRVQIGRRNWGTPLNDDLTQLEAKAEAANEKGELFEQALQENSDAASTLAAWAGNSDADMADKVENGPLTGAKLNALFAPAYSAKQAQQWRTRQDGDRMVQVQPPRFSDMTDPGFHPLVVRRDIRGQRMLGYGASISDAAAWLLKNKLTAEQRHDLLSHLYGPDCGWSTMRVSMGATETFRSPDSPAVYTYDDMPGNALDLDLTSLDVTPDTTRTIPVIKEILAINPQLRIHATISNRPAWMYGEGYGTQYMQNRVPTSNELIGSGVVMQTFANYCVKAIQAWEALGIPVYSFSPINEPFYSGRWNPTKLADFINNHLGPAMRDAKLTTKLLVGEDNTDHAAAAIDTLTRTEQWADGISWHGYTEQVEAAGWALQAFPQKSFHLTEIRNLLSQDWDTAWGVAMGRVVIGATRYGCSSLTYWNLALDENGTATDGVVDYNTAAGRQGVVTVPSDGSGTIIYNTGYWALNHISRFVDTGAQAIGVDSWNTGWLTGGDVMATAFENPDGTVVVIAYNPTDDAKFFNVVDGDTYRGFPVTLEGGEIATFKWGTSAYDTPLGAIPAAPSVPAAPVLTATGQNGQATLSWTVPSSSVPISRYEVLRGGVKVAEVAANVTTYRDKITVALGAGTYAYTVRAVNAAGPGPASASQNATVTRTTPAVVLSAPAVTISGRSPAITWTPSAVEGYDGIDIFRSTVSESVGSIVAELGPKVSSYNKDRPPIGTAVYYTVRPYLYASDGTTKQYRSSTQSASVTVTNGHVRPSIVNKSGEYLDWNDGYQIRDLSRLTNVAAISSTAPNPAIMAAVWLSGLPATPVSCTYGGQAMTLLGTTTVGTRRLALYGLANPLRGIQDLVPVVADTKGSNSIAGVWALTNVDRDNPFRTAVVGTPVTGTTSATVDTTGGEATDLVVMVGIANAAISAVGGSQTRRDDAAHFRASNYPVLTTQDGGTGTITSSVTLGSSGNAALIAVAVKAATS